MKPRITPYVVPRTPNCHPVTSLSSLRLSLGQRRFSSATSSSEAATAKMTTRVLCTELSIKEHLQIEVVPEYEPGKASGLPAEKPLPPAATATLRRRDVLR